MLDDPKYASLKRLLVMLATGAVVVLNRKFGLGMSDAETAALAGLVAAYLLQSGLKDAAKAKGEAAAAAIQSASDADKVLGATPIAKMLLILALPAVLLGGLLLPRTALAHDEGGGSPAFVNFAPIILDQPGNLISIQKVKAGDAALADGRCVDEAAWTALGKRTASAEAKVAEYDASWTPPAWLMGAVGIVALGAGVWIGATYWPRPAVGSP